MKSTNLKVFFILITFFLEFSSSYAQLKIYPEEIEYESPFDRLQNVYFINTGNLNLSIDTIYYKSNLYTIRFDSYDYYPFVIAPGDTLQMDCILSGHFYLTQSDTTDSLILKINSNDSAVVKVKIDFYEDLKVGNISGNVTSDSGSVAGANVNFYYNGTYLLTTVVTDANGHYTADLPVGEYIVSVIKNNYEIIFYNSKNSPIDADKITITEESAANLNFTLKSKTSGGITISGIILDKSAASKINGGIVVIRKGNHTPSKITTMADSSNTYATQINSDGTYNFTNLTAGYYYIQSFSDFYVPTFYSQTNSGVFFWQHGDSVNFSGNMANYNISMLRDSSFGAGTISGKISVSNSVTKPYSDIIVYATSSQGGLPFNYSFVDSSGNYSVKDLPYGSYNIVAQKIGFNDATYNGVINIEPNSYSVGNIDLSIVTGIQDTQIIPNEFQLYQNYPNPFNPSTIISFQVGKTSNVKLKIINILGQEVAELQNGELSPGNYNIKFNAKNLSSGIYFVSLIADGFVQVKKMILLK